MMRKDSVSQQRQGQEEEAATAVTPVRVYTCVGGSADPAGANPLN
jgi:hypothetical protein